METKVLSDRLIEFTPKTSFTIICKGRVVNIEFSQITHISKYGSETVIYTMASEYRTRYSLQEIMNDLPVNDFFRIHRSHIIALHFMNGVKKKWICVGEYLLPISKYYKGQVIKSLQSFLDKEFEFFHEPGKNESQ